MHDRIYKKLVDRDGEICKICKVMGTQKQLVIDHKNNNNSDNRLGNLQLLCRRCNFLKNSGKTPVDSVCVSDCDERPLPPEMKENRRMEPKFRQWLVSKVTMYGRIRYEEALYAGAEYVGASTETIRRYLRKVTSSEGTYVIRPDGFGSPYIHFKDS